MAGMAWIVPTPRGAIITVQAVPRAAHNAVHGLHGDAVKVRLQAPPVANRANLALVGFLAEALNIHPRQLTILAGATGRRKRVAIDGLGTPEIRSRLGL